MRMSEYNTYWFIGKLIAISGDPDIGRAQTAEQCQEVVIQVDRYFV